MSDTPGSSIVSLYSWLTGFFILTGLLDSEVMLNLTSLISKKIEFSYKTVGRPTANLQLTKIIFYSQLHWQGRFNFYILQFFSFFFFLFYPPFLKWGAWVDMLLTFYLLYNTIC